MRIVLTYHVYLPEGTSPQELRLLYELVRETIEASRYDAKVYEAELEEH